ncbi:MAG: DUF2505 domain-containing protein [Actinomycetaceae bacterium]|nr:DUF2505 domain-containing protein [Actinomycetaceae bacterium]
MKFDAEVTYGAPMAQVWSMLRDTQFHEARLRAAHVDAKSVDVLEDGDSFTSVVEIVHDSTKLKLPSMAKRLLPSDSIRATISERWDMTTGEGVLAVDLGGLPVQLEATSRLHDEGESVTRTVRGDLTVTVPMIGKKLEAEAVKQVGEIVAAEEQAAADYLN